MSILVQTTPARVPKSKNTQTIALFYAAILVIMAVAQLFSFDEFLKLVTSFALPGGMRLAYVTAALLVVTEVFAVPFLLRMPLSPAFRWLSMVCGWAVALIWFKITLSLMLIHTPIDNVGFLGTAISIVPSWWAVFISIVFGVLAAWASWGMWPIIATSKSVKDHSRKLSAR